MTFSVLVWTRQSIEVVTGDARYKMSIPSSFEDRHAAALSSDHAGTLCLRAQVDRRPFWISRDGGAHFEPIEPVPGDGAPISAYGCAWHPSAGCFTAVENDRIWIHDGGWRSRHIPDGFTLRSVSVDATGCVWCAGAVPSSRIPQESTEAAIIYQRLHDDPFERYPLRLPPAEEQRAIEIGGMGEFFRIDAASRPVVAASSSSWPFDDPSSFLFLLGDHPFVIKLEEENPSYLDRPSSGVVRAFTMEGGVWRIDGKKVTRDSIMSALMTLLGIEEFWRVMIWRGDARDNVIAVVVSIWRSSGEVGGQEIEATALCVSDDGGATFRLVERIDRDARNERMIVDVALMD